MPVGKNIIIKDKLIKKTTSKVSNKSNVSNTNITHIVGMPSLNPEKETYKTRKMTFYIKEDLLDKLYNYAYWERHSITEALNIVVGDGLRGKNTKRIQKVK